MSNVIEINELTKYYGSLFWKKKTPALDRLTLLVPGGTVFGFLGPNGAGKTTTIKLLMDLIRPSSGQARILGEPPDSLDVKRQIGFLPDAPAFSSYLSAREFLVICAKLLRIPSATRRKRIDEVLDIVKMTNHAGSRLGGFSRGMLQRIGIAQAILNEPKLLILDEPLVGLDPHGRQELKDIIISQKKIGTDVFFSSHILSDVEKMCDSIGILNNGKLLCAGRIDQLLSATGVRLHVNPGCDNIAQDFLPMATGSIKLSDGGWELVFTTTLDLTSKLDKLRAERPGDISVSSSRENLEDFFFRKIESDRFVE
ncbi:MAG: ABC transporter ATP-binding protein [Victivallales bacterium]|nr:ABC transporter ATP-binding protein [Victivallales bacterium]